MEIKNNGSQNVVVTKKFYDQFSEDTILSTSIRKIEQIQILKKSLG